MTEGGFGARYLANGQVQFRFWAPDCDAVNVVIDERMSVPMARNEFGVFEALVECAPGTHYKFQLASGLKVPDPASRLQSGDVHGDSVVVDQAYPWINVAWRGRPWHEAIIYELHTGTFGGFKGIQAQLPRLASLGVTAIELMPIADFPGQFNWGYDGVLPYAPDTAYGTPDDLKAMIDSAHGLGLMVFLDVVYNHFGPDGNYLNSYAGGFFRDDIHTPWGGAIDFRRLRVRRFFIENALYWLSDYRFDGLRFDAVHAILDESFLREMATEIRTKITSRHVHLILENEKNQASLLRATPQDQLFDAQWADDWHHCVHVLLTDENEGYYGDFPNTANLFARCLSEGFAYQGEPSAHAEGAPRGEPSTHLPSTAFVICLQNHDQIGNRAMGERLTVLANPAVLRAAAVLLLMTPQIPMLFMGEEWGETKPFLFFTDHNDQLADAVRAGRRREFAHFATFSNVEKQEKIPDPNARSTFESSVPSFPESPAEEQKNLMELYRSCLGQRAKAIIPRLPGTRSINAEALNAKSVYAAWKMGDGAVLTIAANFGSEPVDYKAPQHELLASSSPDLLSDTQLAGFTTHVWLKIP